MHYIRVEELSVNETSTATLSPIREEDAEISIPIVEVLAGIESGAEVRMAAFLFRNMSGLLPERVDYDDRSGTKINLWESTYN